MHKHILPLLSLGFLVLVASGCGQAESSEYQTVSIAQVTQAEAVQLKPKPLSEFADKTDDASLVDTTAGSADETKSDPSSDDSPKIEKVEPKVTDTTPTVAETNETPQDKQDDTAGVGNATVSQKGAAFLEQNRIANRLKKVEPREIKLLIAERTFKTEGPEDALRMGFDDVDLLKILNMDPVPETAPELFPAWLKQLDGKRVRIRGFMYPAFRATGLKAFVLARDNQICCFGKNPKIYDLMNVILRKGETTDYIQGRPFDVVGVMHIEESEFEGEMFWLDDAIVVD
jgi:hypothetical protein